MRWFHIIVLSIASGLFIFIYGFMLIYYAYPNYIHPNVGDACPDYWVVNPDNTCEIPTNNVNMGDLTSENRSFTNKDSKPTLVNKTNKYGNIVQTSLPSTFTYNAYDTAQIPFGYYLNDPNKVPTFINFNDSGWVSYSSGGSRICGLKKWANQHQIQWDGISNYNKCP